MPPDPAQLIRDAAALKAQGRYDEAVALHEQAVASAPSSPAAEHNLASCLGDAERWSDAEKHARRALAKGGDAPETWLVLARSLQSQGRESEAEQAYNEALRRRPLYADAHRELLQMRWMQSGDVEAALAPLDKAISDTSDSRLVAVKAEGLMNMGRDAESFALWRSLSEARPNDLLALTMTAQAAIVVGEHALARALAERACAMAPAETVPLYTLAEACLAAGDIARGAEVAQELRRRAPTDQHALALQATVWRLQIDPRYRQLYDYAALVRESVLDTPTGWPDLPSYLVDLSAALRAAHTHRTHPFSQSIRHGSQAVGILYNQTPALRALREALDGPIRRAIAALGEGTDPLRARNRGGYRFMGMWSILMRGAGGFHIDHVHNMGWLSSACYVDVPQGLPDKQGWIRFGKPGLKTKPELDAEYFVEPAPGKLVLFPSYMWHGTIPYQGDQQRLTFAFDLAPA